MKRASGYALVEIMAAAFFAVMIVVLLIILLDGRAV